MIDKKSYEILKYLANECDNGYKVIEVEDILKEIKENDINQILLKQTLIYLDKNGYISIKYNDDNVYCVSMLPYGRQFIETRNVKDKQSKDMKITIRKLYFEILLIAFLGAFLGTLISELIF